MAIHHNEHQERISLEEFFALIESDPEHRYEFIDGYPYMMTGGSPHEVLRSIDYQVRLQQPQAQVGVPPSHFWTTPTDPGVPPPNLL